MLKKVTKIAAITISIVACVLIIKLIKNNKLNTKFLVEEDVLGI